MDNKCLKCGNPVQASDKYCPYCGNAINNQKKIVSKGSYSGKMIKGKTSTGWKIFRNTIIGIVLLGIIALIIWFKVDPEAGKKLTNVLMGIGFMLVFFFFGWLFMRGKKGRKSGWDDDQYADVDNNNDYDSDDDD